MIHSPTSLAPLVKHDRVHDNDQTVVTMWDLGLGAGGRDAADGRHVAPGDAQARREARGCRRGAHPCDGAASREIAPSATGSA
jgi:hypothetical protein